MRRGSLYARVSSTRQREQETINSQISALKEICKRNKVKIIREYIDNGWSAGSLARPQLDKLRDDAKGGIWDVLYVYSADRLARDHIDQGIVLRELKKENIQVIFKDRPLTEENKLLTDIESLLAEYEKRQFVERVRRGKLHKMREGKFFRCPTPFGYKFIKNREGYWRLVINPKEAKTVRLIFELYLKYQSNSRVAKELFKMGVRNRTGRLWS